MFNIVCGVLEGILQQLITILFNLYLAKDLGCFMVHS